MLNLIHINSSQTLFLALLLAEHYRKSGEETMLLVEDSAQRDLEQSGLNYRRDFFLVGDIEELVIGPINLVVRQHPGCIRQADRIISKLSSAKDLKLSTFEDGFAIGYLRPLSFSELLAKYNLLARHCLSFDRLHPIEIAEAIEPQLVSSKNLHRVYDSYPALFASAQELMELLTRNRISEVTVVAMRPIGSKDFHRGRYSSARPIRALARSVRDVLAYCGTQNYVLYREDKRDADLTSQAIRRLKASRPHFSLDLDNYLSGSYGLDSLLYLLAISATKVSVVCLNTSFPLIYANIGSNNDYVVGIDLAKIEDYGFGERAKPSFLETHDRMMKHLRLAPSKQFEVTSLSEGLFKISN